MKKEEVKDLILEALESSLELQLRAVRQLRGTEEMPPPVRIRRGLRKESLVDLSVKILRQSGSALHVSEIRKRLMEKYSRITDNDALASSLGKKANQGVILKKSGKGYFQLLEDE